MDKSGRQIVLCAPVRTATGTYGGTLKSVRAPDSRRGRDPRTTLERARLRPEEVQTMVMGQ